MPAEIRELEEHEMPEPMLLTKEERQKTRSLYQTVFAEDSQKFVDFYYEYKIRDNQIYALWEDEQYVSMVHLNPYTMIVNGYEVSSNYIVAVATLKDYRHRGYMRLLLETALRQMAVNKMPFTFLMPASASIYTPFDFVWISPFTELPMRVTHLDADGQNRYLASRYQLFCKRDARYMENLKAEHLAEAGEAPMDEMPPFMARITDVEQMLRLISSREKKTIWLHVKDEVIEKNNGYFCWRTAPDSSKAEKLEDVPAQIDLELTVGELTAMIFESFKICLSEVV